MATDYDTPRTRQDHGLAYCTDRESRTFSTVVRHDGAGPGT